MYGRRDPSVFDSLTLSPLPYPVLFILLVVVLLLAVSWSFNYEDLIESAGEQMNLALLLTPLALLLLIRLLASADSLFDAGAGGLLGFVSPYDRRNRWRFYDRVMPEDGGSASPWGVAAAVVVLLVLVSFRSTFEDMWRP